MILVAQTKQDNQMGVISKYLQSYAYCHPHRN